MYREHGAKVSRDPVGGGALKADEKLGRPMRRSTHGYAWSDKEELAVLQAALKSLRTVEISKSSFEVFSC